VCLQTLTGRVIQAVMVEREALLGDAQWDLIEPLLPPQRLGTGRPTRDHRQVVEGVIYRYRCGIAWRDLPAEIGP
jgi:transposase